jgi:hypothetical protein
MRLLASGKISDEIREYHNKTIYGSYWRYVHPGAHIPASEMIIDKGQTRKFFFSF